MRLWPASEINVLGQHQRRMDQIPQGTFLRGKQTGSVAIDFLNWQLVTGSSSENLKVRVRIGAIEITLPCPLDEPWRELAVNPGNDLTAAHPDSNWVFRGYSPAAPVAIVAEALGYHPTTMERHAVDSATAYSSMSQPSGAADGRYDLLAVDKRIGEPRA